ncbi:phospholipid/cholesterol/gamma-HCH transport system substrate-binding protein [Zhouia amylolytica]|uniref:Phospholipid/cholesterol/gamma-HCH transport system substrate-binding protein n=1 Tax=Zhouia amylolytica TaxID=376730 RepID=A0A1I6RMJ5_9FLAO|nr:MlaD family protein [Zhouia amylolytica]MCQ0110519.1 MCE family protein [Zhouia amylolytica]SFS65925.1 phospholipid/cholesterol/gamma-HCH transport system substrate-binding protein [Zhouia amylolytica]
MARSASERLRLGILVTVATAFLVVAAYLIGDKENMFSKTFSIGVLFNNVNGLKEGNNVRFSGVNVGTVKSITMQNDTTIKVVMVLKEEIQPFIKKDAVATIGTDGLVGNMIINIIPGKNTHEPVQDGDQIKSYSKIGADDLLSTLSVTNENAALLTADLLKVTEALTEGKGTLGRLLNDTTMAEDLSKTLTNLKYASYKATTSLEQLSATLNGVDRENSIANVLFKDTLSGMRLKSVIRDLENSGENLDSLLTNLNLIVYDIKGGKGALKYLTTDTVLVQQLEKTIQNIESGTESFNQNMEALKHNFLFRRYFKKLEKEQEKQND